MDIELYIPHRRTMKLIDKIIDENQESFTVEVAITSSSLLSTENGVPSYAGLEYMAQSIAAFNSYHFKNELLSNLGFIVSIRNYQSSLDYYPLQAKLEVKIKPNLIVNNSGTFSCEILLDREIVSTGSITAYVPTKEELETLKREKVC